MTAIRDALRAIIDTLDAEEMGEGPPASEHVAHWQKLHDDGTAALAALDAETEGWRTDTMPTLERVMVAGWQPRSGTTRGYWWYGEDATDEKGMPIDHPNATLWIRLTDLLPAFPPEARS